MRYPDGHKATVRATIVKNAARAAIDAPPEAVWNALIQAETWPSWYEGATDVKVTNGKNGQNGQGSTFAWSTMGLDFVSRVTEFEPPLRLSWESRKSTIQGYHAWLIIPTGAGSRLVTEESQHGFLTLMQTIFQPNDLHRLDDIWLFQIKNRAEAAAHGSRQAAGAPR